MSPSTPDHGAPSGAAAESSERSWRSKLGQRAPRGAPPAPGLYLVSTPIGHGDDITLRALDMLERADLVLCEDTRVTSKLLALHGLDAKLAPYHDHNGAQMRPKVIRALEEGQVVALVSDAGTPLVSDPGYKLAREVANAGHAVQALPGASSPLAALAVSGLPSDRFLFAGFLPAKQTARVKVIEQLSGVPATLIFFETGPRLAAALRDLAATLGDRPAAVCRELTKKFEEVRRAPLADLADRYAGEPAAKGEIVIVIGPPEETAAADIDLDAALRAAMADAPLKSAVADVVDATGLPKRTVYQRALALKAEGVQT